MSLIFNLEKDDLDFVKIWVFPKIGVPQNGWFILENPIKLDGLGVPLFFGNIHIFSIFIDFICIITEDCFPNIHCDLFAKKESLARH